MILKLGRKVFEMIGIIDDRKTKVQSDFISPEQFEEMFGISIPKQYKLRLKINYTEKYRSKVPPSPYIRVGKKILYSVKSVNEWLKKQEIK